MNDILLPNDKCDSTLNSDYPKTYYRVNGTVESSIYNLVDKSIKYMFDKLMKALPNDTARLFFLQSELLRDELKEYRTNETIEINQNDFEQKYYLEVKTKLKQLKEQCEQTRL